jgi:hypothetical protein
MFLDLMSTLICVWQAPSPVIPNAKISSTEIPMEPVRTGLRQIMQDLLRTRPAEEAVMLAWPLVCGKEVAARTCALSFANGNLIVEVQDTTWRNQLQSFTSRYINGYEGLLGKVVQSVQFRIKPSTGSNQQSSEPSSP